MIGAPEDVERERDACAPAPGDVVTLDIETVAPHAERILATLRGRAGKSYVKALLAALAVLGPEPAQRTLPPPVWLDEFVRRPPRKTAQWKQERKGRR